MTPIELDGVRDVLKTSLQGRGDLTPVADNESLFVSGRLDSLAMIGLITYLEQAFGIDFGVLDFDVGMVDSLANIASLVDIERRR